MSILQRANFCIKEDIDGARPTCCASAAAEARAAESVKKQPILRAEGGQLQAPVGPMLGLSLRTRTLR
jgi:hypothetical protein